MYSHATGRIGNTTATWLPCFQSLLNIRLIWHYLPNNTLPNSDLQWTIKQNTYWSIAGTANCPVGVIIAPGTPGPSTGTIKLRGIPVLFLISIDSCKTNTTWISKFNIHGSVHRNYILIWKSQQDAQVTEFIFIWWLLYMFRVSLSPIFRSTKQLITVFGNCYTILLSVVIV
jgi:hypothetical protein